jgi:AraC-like DNA-binding protein
MVLQPQEIYELLAGSTLVHEYLKSFGDAMELPVALRPVDSWQLPLRGLERENRFCAHLIQTGRASAACLQTQQQLAAQARSGPATMSCWCGFSVTAVPVMVKDQLCGFLQTGQVFQQPPTPEQFQMHAGSLATCHINPGSEALARSFLQSRVVSSEQYESMVRMLEVFARHLSLMGEQIVAQRENAEPVMIRRAKEFIDEHHSENLRLAQVARAVNSSPFYFCKMFKRHTGVNFTEFVARVRIDKAKNLLLNPDVHVSEIAYAVGFQSLTHFNRTFKKLTGQPPSKYRARLCGVPDAGPRTG